MKKGICPKCGSATIFAKADGLKFSAMKGLVFVETGGATMASAAVAYVCTTCGYFENYINDPNKLAVVEKNWQKVTPQG